MSPRAPAGACAGSQQGPPTRHCAYEHDVRHRDWRLGQVTPGQRCFAGLGQGEKAVVKAVDPGAPAPSCGCELRRQTEGKKGSDRTGAHGGQVGKMHGQGLAAQPLGIGVGQEMAAGHQHVGGYDQFHAGRGLDQRGVVADAQRCGPGRPGEVAGDQFEFGRHVIAAVPPP